MKTRQRFYGELPGRLGERMRKLAESQHRHTLDEELDLARATVQDSVDLYAALLTSNDKNISPEAIVKAGSIVRSAINDIAALVERSLKVRAESQELIRLDSFKFILSQMESILREEFGEAMADRITSKILATVKLTPEVRVTVE